MKNFYLLIMLLLAALVISQNVQSTEQAELNLQAGENTDFWRPNEILALSFSSDQIKRLNKTLVVELDAIDITAVLIAQGKHFIFKPLQPLSAGQHDLRVVEYSEEGDIEELAYWSIEVRQSELIQQYQLAVNNQVTVNYRIADKNIGMPEPDELQGQAISQVAFTSDSGNWHSSGQFDLYYDSLESNQINNRALNNNDFLFSVGNEHIEARLGHQSMAVTSLVMDNFRRRGVSLESKITSINSRLSGFSLSGPHVIGFGNGLGINDSQQRVEGITFDSSPLVDDPRALYITGTWLKGRSANVGPFITNAIPIPITNTESEAWSLSGESLLFKNKLRLRAEYAQTDYDFDITDGLGSDEDNAYSLLVTYNDVIDSKMAWNVGAASQKIGTYFRSMANQALPSDKQINKIFSGTQWHSFGLEVNFERQQDNVEKIDFLPVVNTNLSNLAFNWTPIVENFDAWYGAPSFALTNSFQSQLQTYTPDNYLFSETHNEISHWQISSQFSYPSNSWGLAITSTDFTDFSLLQSNSETLSYDLYASFVFGEDARVSISPIVSWNDTKDTSNQITSTSVSYALQSTMSLIPKALNASLNVNWNSNQVGNNLLDGDNLSATFAINWSIRQAKANQFGVDLALTSAYHDFNDNLFSLNSVETQQTYLSFTITFPYQAQTNE